MRIIALLFNVMHIVLFISSSEDMPYTQYRCRVRVTEIIHKVRLSFVKEQKHSSVWMESFHTSLNSREEFQPGCKKENLKHASANVEV